MKIENNGLNPISPKRTEAAQGIDRKDTRSEAGAINSGKDRAELSENARLLAKARASLEELSEVERERVERLREQIDSGTYTVPVEDLAKRLVSRLYTNNEG